MSANQNERRRGPQIEEQELASRTIQIQNKRFYLDVKQNPRGRFIKLTEVGVGGQKSRILMSVPAANELREKIEKLSAAYEKLSPHNPKSLATDGLIESETIVRDNRRYYLDLRENERGRFLRISMLSMGARVHIGLPADGLVELRNALADLIQNYCRAEDLAATQDLPEAKVLFAGNKTFYFDVGSNRYGVFLRISELRANYRTAVTIPEHHWTRFRDILSDLASKIDNAKSTAKTNGDSSGSRGEPEDDEEADEEREKKAGVSSSSEAKEADKKPATSITTTAAAAPAVTDAPEPKTITVS